MTRILVLQEMEQNIINLKEALGDRYELVFARHELKALELSQREHFDLIICAVYLEQSDVFDFTRVVKNHPNSRDIPIVFYCSAISTFARSVRNGLKIAAESMGVDLFVTMEVFDGPELEREIEDCLTKKQYERAVNE